MTIILCMPRNLKSVDWDSYFSARTSSAVRHNGSSVWFPSSKKGDSSFRWKKTLHSTTGERQAILFCKRMNKTIRYLHERCWTVTAVETHPGHLFQTQGGGWIALSLNFHRKSVEGKPKWALDCNKLLERKKKDRKKWVMFPSGAAAKGQSLRWGEGKFWANVLFSWRYVQLYSLRMRK